MQSGTRHLQSVIRQGANAPDLSFLQPATAPGRNAASPAGRLPAGLASGTCYGARMYRTELAGRRVRVSVLPGPLVKFISETVMYGPETLVTHAT